MIVLHKLNGDEFVLNVHLIETVEERPDTVITLSNDKKYLVKEKILEVIDLALSYERNSRIIPKT
jgi:flagellar protein FlbD